MLGILLIISKLACLADENTVFWICLPEKHQDLYKDQIDKVYSDLNINFFDIRTCEIDRYFVKLGLIRLVENLDPDDMFLYLDYDHLVLNRFDFKKLSIDHVHVSSEVTDIPEVNYINHQKHYNNSFIFGLVSNIHKITKGWFEIYSLLDKIFEKREEISFNLSAQRNSIKLSPVAFVDQNYFGENCCKPSLFHYGGSSLESNQMKCYLKTRSFEFKWCSFNIKELFFEHSLMLKKLNLYKNYGI